MSNLSLTRRAWLARTLGGAAAIAVAGPARFAAALVPPTPITVHKDASCGCCEKWISHMRASGFRVDVRDEKDIDGVKDQLGVPKGVRSCHTALVGGYLVEGHVPASDVRKLLDTRPRVVGLAVPGMPSGTPGMEGPRGAQPYEVLSWDARGATKLYAKH
jgi:hypothetical protein